MRHARWFRLLALWAALLQAASLPTTGWADALLQARAASVEATFGVIHAESSGAHHPRVAHDGKCLLCTHLVAGREPAPAQEPLPRAATLKASPGAPRLGARRRASRTSTLPRAPPRTA